MTILTIIIIIAGGLAMINEKKETPKSTKVKIPPKEYWQVAEKIYEATNEIATVISVRPALSAERLKPTMLKEVCRKEGNDIICIYELLRTGHIPENERIAADKIQRIVLQINNLQGVIAVEQFKYLESVAQIRVRYITEK